MALTEIPVELSSTPGIADSSNATAITIDSSENTTFGGQVIAPNGATSGYYLKQVGGTATPRVTNDGNNWTVIRPGASGSDVAINNYANSANLVVFTDEGDISSGSQATGGALIKGVSGDQADVTNGGFPQYTFVGNAGTGMRRASANTLAFDSAGDERMRIDSDGHMGFNTSGIQTFTNYTSYHFGPAGTTNTALLIDDENGASGRLQLFMAGSAYIGTRSDDDVIFTSNDSERGRIKNSGMWIIGGGQIAIGTTSLTGGASSGNVTIEFAGNSETAIKTRDTSSTSGSAAMVFVNGSNAVGTISTNSSATAYNTSSDYRLKENVNYDWDALTTLKQLKPAKFNFKLDADNTVEGFLAHEVSGLVPAAVKGEKDAMETRTKLVLDSKGEVIEEDVEQDVWTAGKEDETYPADSTWEASKEYPSYQQIDHSKLVPLMVKAIQELEAKVKALEEA